MSLSVDPKFQIQIDNGSTDPNMPILGLLPERFDFDVSSDWQTPLAPGAAFGYLGALFRFGLAELGMSAISKWQTVALWSGTAPINVALPIIFVADSQGEAKTKVLDPIKTLMKLAVPKDLGGGFLQPPGPKPDGGYASEKLGLTGGEDITVRIGRFLTFRKDGKWKMNAIGTPCNGRTIQDIAQEMVAVL